MNRRNAKRRAAKWLSVAALVGSAIVLQSSSVRATSSNDPRGYFDSATRVSGGVRVQGWALDPNTSAAIEVHVYVDGQGSSIGLANRERQDVAAAYPGYGANHGFDAIVGPGASVCAYGINVGNGTNSLLGCLNVPVVPFGSLDVLTAQDDGMRVQGWAIDPDTSAPIDVHVYVDNRIVAGVNASLDRADVARSFPGLGAQHGYDIVVPNGSRVCTYGINQGAGNNSLLGCLDGTPRQTEPARMAQDLLSRVSDERSARGVSGLVWDENLASGARSWAEEMSRSGIRHSPGAGQDYGENIQYLSGATSGALHLNWMNSDDHRDNILWPAYGSVGIGVFCGDDGVVWAVQRFSNIDPAKEGPMDSPRDPIADADQGGLGC